MTWRIDQLYSVLLLNSLIVDKNSFIMSKELIQTGGPHVWHILYQHSKSVTVPDWPWRRPSVTTSKTTWPTSLNIFIGNLSSVMISHIIMVHLLRQSKNVCGKNHKSSMNHQPFLNDTTNGFVRPSSLCNLLVSILSYGQWSI